MRTLPLLRLPLPLQSKLQRLWPALGWPGLVALASSGAALLLLAWWLPAQTQALELQRAQLTQARQALQTGQRQSVVQSPLPFVQSLPPDDTRQARTAALLALATELGLPWPRSEFRYSADAALGLAQYRIAMTLRGDYTALRSYVAEALRRDPALSLDSLKLRRLQPAGAELVAELSWVLHLQMAQPQTPTPTPTPASVSVSVSVSGAAR
jgi:hypothetical protein